MRHKSGRLMFENLINSIPNWKTYLDEDTVYVIQRWMDGATPSQLAKELGMHRSTINYRIWGTGMKGRGGAYNKLRRNIPKQIVGKSAVVNDSNPQRAGRWGVVESFDGTTCVLTGGSIGDSVQIPRSEITIKNRIKQPSEVKIRTVNITKMVRRLIKKIGIDNLRKIIDQIEIEQQAEK